MLFSPLLQIESKLREWYYYSLLAKTKYPRSHHKQFNVNYAKVTSVKEPFLTPDHVCVDKAANIGAKLFVGNRQRSFNIASGSEANITTPCEMDIFNFLWLIWDHYLPLAPT